MLNRQKNLTGTCSLSSRCRIVRVRAEFKLSYVTTTQASVNPADVGHQRISTNNGAGLGIALFAGAAILGVVAFAKAKSGSVTTLEQRGYLQQSRDSSDPFLKDVMKDMNTVQIDPLSSEQILAARHRRSKERANQKLSLEDIEIPDNHPWATKSKISQEDEEKIRARLSVKRSVPGTQKLSQEDGDLNLRRMPRATTKRENLKG